MINICVIKRWKFHVLLHNRLHKQESIDFLVYYFNRPGYYILNYQYVAVILTINFAHVTLNRTC